MALACNQWDSAKSGWIPSLNTLRPCCSPHRSCLRAFALASLGPGLVSETHPSPQSLQRGKSRDFRNTCAWPYHPHHWATLPSLFCSGVYRAPALQCAVPPPRLSAPDGEAVSVFLTPRPQGLPCGGGGRQNNGPPKMATP